MDLIQSIKIRSLTLGYYQSFCYKIKTTIVHKHGPKANRIIQSNKKEN